MSNKGNLYDIIIIGNGILGLQSAFFLKTADQNLKIALISPPDRTGCATLAAAAMINVFAEIDYGMLENIPLWERFQLTYRGGQLWDKHAEALSQYSDEPLQIKRGTYVLVNARSTAIEVRSLNYIKKVIPQLGHHYENIDPNTISWLKSGDDACPIETIKIDDGYINSRQVVQALDRAMKALGIDVFPTQATRLSQEKKLFGSKEKLVTLESGEVLQAPHIVFANGAYAQQLINQIPDLRAQTPHLLYGAGFGLDLSFPQWVRQYGGLDKEIFKMDAVIRTLDRGGNCGLHVVPLGNGEFFVGASSGVWMEPEPFPRLHGIKSLVLGAISEINYGFFHANTQVRANGYRPITLDCFPLLGESEMKGYWFINGTKRDGFTMSPYICQKLASSIIHQRQELPHIFRPSRPLISYKTQAEAIKSAQLMLDGADRQHGGIQAPYMVPSYHANRYQWVDGIYAKRKIEGFGIHPEVLHLYENDDFYRQVKHPFETKNNTRVGEMSELLTT